jgi:PKHD-type hydroxylase
MSYPLTTRVHSIKKDMLAYTFLDDVFTEQEMQDVIKYCNNLPLEDATIGEGNLAPNYRKSKVCQFKVHNTNEWIFDRLQTAATFLNNEFFRFDLIGFDKIQYTEYRDDNNLYDFHVDCWMGDNTPADHVFPRKLSFSLCLSKVTEYDGGKFEVMYSKQPEQVTQKYGRLIAFPSYMLHRVTPVTQGIRKSLVFWVIGPKFR